MKIPQWQIDRMLADGALGILVSSICLGAALAVKRGGDTRLTDIQSDEPIDERTKAFIQGLHAERVAEFQAARPEDLDGAIALYREHLRQAGYAVTDGQDN